MNDEQSEREGAKRRNDEPTYKEHHIEYRVPVSFKDFGTKGPAYQLFVKAGKEHLISVAKDMGMVCGTFQLTEENVHDGGADLCFSTTFLVEEEVCNTETKC